MQMGCNVYSRSKLTLIQESSWTYYFIKKINISKVLDLNRTILQWKILTLGETIIRKEVRSVLVKKNTNWDSFRTGLNRGINGICSWKLATSLTWKWSNLPQQFIPRLETTLVYWLIKAVKSIIKLIKKILLMKIDVWNEDSKSHATLKTKLLWTSPNSSTEKF